MKKLSQISAIAAMLCLTTAAAQAEIIWDQQGAADSRTTYGTTYGTSYGSSQLNRQGLHENLEFHGNVRLSASDTRKLQQALKQRGFYKGRIDGIWGGQTTQAILDYQAVNEQPLTGTVNAGTLSDLGVYIDPARYATR